MPATYVQKSIVLDPSTNAMLKELSGSNASRYIRHLIVLEFGKLLERREMARRESSSDNAT